MNRLTFVDVLNSNRDIVLNDLCNIKRYGNVQMNDYIYSVKVKSGTMNIGGIFTYFTFGGYLDGDKIESLNYFSITNPLLNPTIISFDGYHTDNKTKVKILASPEIPSGNDLWLFYSDDLSKLWNNDLNMFDDIDPYDNGAIYTTGGSIVSSTGKAYFQSVLYNIVDETYTVLSKSHIISFDTTYVATNPTNIANPYPTSTPSTLNL